MGPLDGALAILGGDSAAPAPAAGGSSKAGIDYMNDPKNRAAIMADMSRIAAMRPDGNSSPAKKSPATVAGPLDGAISLLSSPDAAQAAMASAKPTRATSLSDLPGAAVEPIATMATGAIGGLVGGVTRLGSAALGNNFADAKAAGDKVQNALTYQPQTQGGKASMAGLGDLASSAKNALMSSAVGPALSAVGKSYKDTFVSGASNPLMATVNDMLPTVAANVVAGKAGSAALDAAGSANALMPKTLATPTPVTAAARIEPTMGAKPRVKLNVDGSQTPISPNAAPPSPIAQAVAPTLADATPELQAAIQKMKAKGDPINNATLQRHVEADSLPVPVKLTGGQAALSPSMISDEMNGRGKVKPTVSPQFYNAQGKALGANLDAIRANVAPDVGDAHPTAHGQTLVDAYKNMDAPVRADISVKYQALKDANGGDFPVAGQDIAAAADQGLKSSNVTRFLPSEVKGILEDIRQPGNMTFDDFQNYLTILGQQERKAARAGDGTAGHAIGVVRNAFESLPMTAENAHLKPLLDAARGAAKDRFDKIKADPAYKAAISDEVPAGQPSPLADKFVSGYVTGGNVRGANLANMKANLASDSGAHQTIAAATLDHLKGLAKVDPETGKFMADSYGKAVTQLSPKLVDMVGPEAAQQLQQVANVSKYTSAQPKGSYVNNSSSMVAALSAPAAAGIRSLLAIKTLGASEAVGAAFGALKQGKAAKNAIAPGASVNKLMKTPP